MNLLDRAINYNQIFQMNVIPLIGKKPKDEWKIYQNDKMTVDEIMKMVWDGTITGLAAICGINDLICIDLDWVKSDKILTKILDYLNLPADYKWIVKTKTGYHIWIKMRDKNKVFGFIGKGFAYKKFYPKEKNLIKHIELRIMNCYAVLPPSEHPKGGVYEFLNGEPENEPDGIESDNIIYMLKELFSIVNNEKIAHKNKNWKPDIKYLSAAIEHLKEYRLGYDIWRDCCFALCSLGEDGKEYFRELSNNTFYPNDSTAVIDNQFNECLKRYDKDKIKLNTLFYYAIELGYKYGRKRDLLTKVMLTFPLSLLQCENEELIDNLISYGLIKRMEEKLKNENEIKKITASEIKDFLDKYKIDFLLPKDVLKKYLEIEQATGDFENQFNTDAYGLIGLDLLLDCKRGKFNFSILRSYAAVRAILGRTIKHKWINYTRIIYAYYGYKSEAVFNQIGKSNILISTKTLYRNFLKLRELGFLSCFYYARKTYFSTYYNQKVLQGMVEKRILESDEKKLNNSDSAFRERINEKRKKLKLKKIESYP